MPSAVHQLHAADDEGVAQRVGAEVAIPSLPSSSPRTLPAGNQPLMAITNTYDRAPAPGRGRAHRPQTWPWPQPQPCTSCLPAPPPCPRACPPARLPPQPAHHDRLLWAPYVVKDCPCGGAGLRCHAGGAGPGSTRVPAGEAAAATPSSASWECGWWWRWWGVVPEAAARGDVGCLGGWLLGGGRWRWRLTGHRKGGHVWGAPAGGG